MTADSKNVNDALMRSYMRAENPDDDSLGATFVTLPQLKTMMDSPEHQILYGRRGTGKTHLLRLLAQERLARCGAALYIDLLRIGSNSSVYSDTREPLTHRATTMLVDVLNAIHAGIQELVILNEDVSAGLHVVGPALDEFADAAVDVRVVGSVEIDISATSSSEITAAAGVGLHAGPGGLGLSGTASRQRSAKAAAAQRRHEQGTEEHHLVFGRVATALSKLVQCLHGASLWLLLDEWSSLPLDLQPYLADLLRRNVFTVHGVTVKIGAIDRRSRFIVPGRYGDYLGMELGSDTASTINIDDYLTFDSERRAGRIHAERFFSEVLFRHASSYLAQHGEEVLFSSPRSFLDIAFATGAFSRLVEVGEGVPRDALQIAQMAASKVVDRPIDRKQVDSAASDYCNRQKEGRLSRRAAVVLNAIIEQCATAECRVIALRRGAQAASEVVAELYDQRLLHRRQQGVAGLEGRPLTEKYDLFLVDLGSFMDLIRQGQLLVRDDGGRDRGISLGSKKAVSGAPKRAAYTFVTW
jgi:hypothetical protein